MSRKVLIISFITLFILLGIALFMVLFAGNKQHLTNPVGVKYIHNQGEAQGTTYSVIYQQPEGIDLQSKIEERLRQFDLSLSTYNPQSIISKINRNDSTVTTDIDFENMYRTAHEVSVKSGGAFDITVGPLVKAWGFAFGNKNINKIPDVKSLLKQVGYDKITLINHHLIKSNAAILIDANALAQGQSVDVIAKLLEQHGCKNYLVEIGGEISCRGLNDKNLKWTIGIDNPVDDSIDNNNGLQSVIQLSGCAVSTSGNYRKFYYLNNKKYAHEIDPKTGYPVQHNLLSATVIAPSCILADAYSTAFMVMGVDKSLQLCKTLQGMECYLIYTDKNGNYQVASTAGFQKYLTKNSTRR